MWVQSLGQKDPMEKNMVTHSSILACKIPWVEAFRMDWLDLFAVQGTLKSLFQHHSSKAAILQCSAFFMVQISPPRAPRFSPVPAALPARSQPQW